MNLVITSDNKFSLSFSKFIFVFSRQRPMTDPTKKVLGIHGNSSYMEFEFSFFTLPMYLLFTPLIYVPITLIIDLRIFAKLMNAKLEKHINVHLFKSICMFQFMVRSEEIIKWNLKHCSLSSFSLLIYFISVYQQLEYLRDGVRVWSQIIS